MIAFFFYSNFLEANIVFINTCSRLLLLLYFPHEKNQKSIFPVLFTFCTQNVFGPGRIIIKKHPAPFLYFFGGYLGTRL